jgi:hypothetical protein
MFREFDGVACRVAEADEEGRVEYDREQFGMRPNFIDL